jgi:hypothetical protein
MSQTNVSVYSWRSKLSLPKLQVLTYLQLNLSITQEAICSSLEDYNRQIEELKRDMNDATLGAENIRNDITALSQRYAVVKRDETCRVSKINSYNQDNTRFMRHFDYTVILELSSNST